MKVAILGYGVEGKSAYAYWNRLGAIIEIRNQTEVAVPDGASVRFGDEYLADLDAFDVLVRTPSLRPDVIAAANPGIDTATRTTSAVREFMAKCPAPIVGVTGSKGKGTTATLIARIIEASGRKAFIGGNIGLVPLDFIDEVSSRDVAVLELSSFQLFDVTQSPQIAVGLMIVPEHLNWHTSFEEYTEAKGNIFRYQTAADLAVFHGGNEVTQRLAELSSGRKVPYGRKPGAYLEDEAILIDEQKICSISEVGLLGPHNLENICAAITATWELVEHNVAAIKKAVTEFGGLPHHLELVGEVKGVRYYDDSFSTTPEAAIAAFKSFDEAKIAILGGSDKGTEFAELAREVDANNVIHALLIGDTAAKIADELTKIGYTHFTLVKWQGMEQLILTASHLAEPGDVVLLSPACASFGLFDNYKQRGELFAAAVLKLAGEGA